MAFGISAGTAALIGGGLSLAGAVYGANASQNAAGTAAGAANNATQTQLDMFNTTNAQNAPWRQAGQNALGQLYPGGSTTLDPQFTHQFNNTDLNSQLAPNYQWQLDTGLGAVKNAANQQTGLLSGNTLTGVNNWAQNYAGNAYQNAFNNYNSQQTNIFNRLSTIAGYGSTANQTTAQAGTQLGTGAAQSQVASGAYTAAGGVNAANAISGGINNAAGWYGASQAFGNGSNNLGYNPTDYMASLNAQAASGG